MTMHPSRPLRTASATLFLTALLSGLPPAAFAAQARPAPRAEAQTPPTQAAVPPTQILEDQNARQTRQRLREILEQYPPSVAQVLRLDPSLLNRPEYLAPYPFLAGFLAQHPEVAHNPVFFFGETRFENPETDKARAMRMMEDVLAGVAGLTVFVGVITFLAWLLRNVIDYRYWLRASKIQTEAHAKVFDRLTTNEDVLAYVQSPAGQRYLSSTSVSVDAPRTMAAPVSRILWSVQAGVVLALAGIGLWFAKGNVIEEIAELLYIVSILAIAVGVGFVASAVISYVMSQRLGLFEPPANRSTHA